MEKNTMNKSSWRNLPCKLLESTYRYLSHGDLQQLRLVCKHWHDIANFEFIPKTKVVINLHNMATIHNRLQNDKKFSSRWSYDSVEIDDINNSDYIKSILKALGPKIRKLNLRASPIFTILNDYLPELEELNIRNTCTLERERIPSLDLSKFKNFKSLDIMSFCDTVIDMAESLTWNEAVKMEKLCADIRSSKHQEIITHILKFHSKTLKHVELDFSSLKQDNWKWAETFAMLKNLEVLKLKKVGCKRLLHSIMDALPMEAPLRYLYLDQILPLDIKELVIKKWPGFLLSVDLTAAETVHDVDIINFKIFHHNLRDLKIKSNEVSANSLLHGIASETNNVLKTLEYTNNKLHSNDSFHMQTLVERLPHLTSLSVTCAGGGCIDDAFLSSIFGHLLNLQYLHLGHCTKVTDKGLLGFGSNPAPITNLKRLQSLSLQFSREITDFALINCFKFIELRKLSFGSFHAISSTGIKETVKNCPALEEIQFVSCSSIDDDYVHQLTRGLPRFRKFKANLCRSVRHHSSVDYFLDYCMSKMSVTMSELKPCHCQKKTFRGKNVRYPYT